MKYKLAIFTLIISAAFLFNACKEESPTSGENPPPPAQGGYFPNADGNYYKYAIEREDSNGTKTTGTRSTTYTGTQVVGNTTYQIQIDSITIAGISGVSASLFWKSETGVFYFIDTTGLSEFIPADLPVTIGIDSVLRAFTFPFSSVSSWPVFVMNASIGSLLSLKVIEITGAYQGDEQVQLNLSSGQQTVSAAKIKFTLTLNIPDDPANPFVVIPRSYDAFCWIADDVGIVKWQGNGTILNLFSGNIDLADTNTVTTQSLIEYNLN